MSLPAIAIWIVVIAGIIGIVLVSLQQIGAVPPFVIRILWIIMAVVIGIAAIRLVDAMV